MKQSRWMSSFDDALRRLTQVTGKQSLLAPEVVEHLVRDYLASVLDLPHRKAPTSEVWGKVQRLSSRFQATFYGQRGDFLTSRLWHSPAALGRYLCDEHELGGNPDDALVRLCQIMAARLIEIRQMYADEGLAMEEFGAAMELIVEQHVHCLRGVRFHLH